MTDPIITAVVPVFNRVDLVRPALASVFRAAARHPGVEVVLVDNGSTDGAEQVVASYGDRATVLWHSGSIAALRNYGARAGTGHYVSFLDSDVVVPDDYFARLERLLAADVADAVGCEYHLPDQPCWTERVWHLLTVREDDGPRHYINSGNFAVTRAIFERVNGFPEDFETAEDTEICRRIEAAGGRIYQSQQIAVKHLGNPKTVRGFYRRLRWHGLQIRDGQGRIYRATAFALIHVAVVALAIVFACAAWGTAPAARVAAVAGALVALPAAVYAFRVRQVRRVVDPVAALFLIEVMLLARASAFGRVLVTQAKRTA